VLLSALDDAALDRSIADTTLTAFTARTVTDPDRLGALIRQVRQDGYALVDQELEEGLRSLAVPLTNQRGQVKAAMNVSAHSNRVSDEQMTARFLPVLRDAAARAGRGLG
jgi:IclR family pca regulon transcriptional regulator